MKLTWFDYSKGAVDKQGLEQIEQGAQRIKTALEEEKYDLATNEWGELEGLVEHNTYGIDFYNILKQVHVFRGFSIKLIIIIL